MDHIILFDGVCNFCNSSINFIIHRDPRGRYKFASIQSNIGQELIKQYQIDRDVDSVILIENGVCYTESTAALKIGKNLNGFPKWLYVLILVPRVVRDGCYRWFAKRRYRFFGKQDACMIPSKEVRERFLMDE